MFVCEIYCNNICVLPATIYPSLRKVAEDLELTTNQVYDIYEGRTIKKYASKMMPKIRITRETKLLVPS